MRPFPDHRPVLSAMPLHIWHLVALSADQPACLRFGGCLVPSSSAMTGLQGWLASVMN